MSENTHDQHQQFFSICFVDNLLKISHASTEQWCLFTSGTSQRNCLAPQKTDKGSKRWKGVRDRERERETDRQTDKQTDRETLVNWSPYLWPIYLSNLALQQLSQFRIPRIVNPCFSRCPWPCWLWDYLMNWDEINGDQRIHSEMCQGKEDLPVVLRKHRRPRDIRIPRQPEESKKPFTTRNTFIHFQRG